MCTLPIFIYYIGGILLLPQNLWGYFIIDLLILPEQGKEKTAIGRRPLVLSLRQTLPHAQSPPSQLRIWPWRISSGPSGPSDQIRLHLLPVEKGIMPLNNAPLHQEGCAACHKGSCKGGSRHRLISPAAFCRHNIHARGSQIRLYPAGLACIAASGKIRIRAVGVIIRSNRNNPCRCGGDGERGLRHRLQEAGRWI